MTRIEAEQIALKLREVGRFATQELQFIVWRLEKISAKQGREVLRTVQQQGWSRHRFDRVLDALPIMPTWWGGQDGAEIPEGLKIEYVYGCAEVWSAGKWTPLDGELRAALEKSGTLK